MGACLSCFKSRDRNRSSYKGDGNHSDFGGSDHSRSTNHGKKKRIFIRKKTHDITSGEDSDYQHETQSLLEKSESNGSSDGGLLNSRGTRSSTSNSIDYREGSSSSSSYQQVNTYTHNYIYIHRDMYIMQWIIIYVCAT